jgi:hypothetical protein
MTVLLQATEASAPFYETECRHKSGKKCNQLLGSKNIFHPKFSSCGDEFFKAILGRQFAGENQQRLNV